MTRDEIFDAAVVGGGVMGCSAALQLARGGMRTVLLDKSGLCMEASGVNAGTLTMHMVLITLTPYALKGWELWKSAQEWLGYDVGFREREGLSLAFSEREAVLLKERAEGRIRQGAPFEIIDGKRARQIEPGLSEHVVLAAHCRIDGFAVAHLLGRAFRLALTGQGVDVRERSAVEGIDRAGGCFEIRTATGLVRARRLLLSAGAWMEHMLAWFGLNVPITPRINQLAVTERTRKVMNTVIGVASGGLSLKQFDNGTVLIGGGWQGRGDIDRGAVEVIPENFLGNVRLAQYCIPGLADARLARGWLGLESRTPDKLPLAGALPGVEGAYALSCVHSGFTSGPYIGRLVADMMLDRDPEMPLFDPGRFAVSRGAVPLSVPAAPAV